MFIEVENIRSLNQEKRFASFVYKLLFVENIIKCSLHSALFFHVKLLFTDCSGLCQAFFS